jgi:hypothetical protein
VLSAYTEAIIILSIIGLRILALFDPLKCQASLPLTVEGIHIDYLQRSPRDLVYKLWVCYVSPHYLQSSVDASPRQESPWCGLDGAHPFKQGIPDRQRRRRRNSKETSKECTPSG